MLSELCKFYVSPTYLIKEGFQYTCLLKSFAVIGWLGQVTTQNHVTVLSDLDEYFSCIRQTRIVETQLNL